MCTYWRVFTVVKSSNLPSLKNCHAESKERTQQAENLCTKDKQGMVKVSDKVSTQVKPVATGITDHTMITNTCAIIEEEQHKGCRACFGWLFRLFRRRRGRHSEEDLDSHDVTFQQSTACVMPLVNDVDDKKQEGKQEIRLWNDLLSCVMEVAEEQHEYMETKSVEGKGEDEQEGRAVLTWAEEVTQAEEQGLDVFAPVSEALLDVLHHFAPATLTNGEAAVSEYGHARSAAVTATPAARRRARRKARKALRGKSEAHSTSDNDTVTNTAATTPAPTATVKETNSSTEENAAGVATTHKVSASLKEEDAATKAKSGIMNSSQRRRARRKAAAAERVRSGKCGAIGQ